MKIARILGVTGTIAALAYGNAWPDTQSDLLKAQHAFAAVQSFHADIEVSNGQKVGIDFVAPATYHEILPQGFETVITPSVVKMKVNGQWMTVPKSMTGHALDNLGSARSFADTASLASAKITDLGMDGAFHKYRYDDQNTQTFVWIRGDGLPDHIQTQGPNGTATIHYSGYNSTTITIPG